MRGMWYMHTRRWQATQGTLLAAGASARTLCIAGYHAPHVQSCAANGAQPMAFKVQTNE